MNVPKYKRRNRQFSNYSDQLRSTTEAEYNRCSEHRFLCCLQMNVVGSNVIFTKKKTRKIALKQKKIVCNFVRHEATSLESRCDGNVGLVLIQNRAIFPQNGSVSTGSLTAFGVLIDKIPPRYLCEFFLFRHFLCSLIHVHSSRS